MSDSYLQDEQVEKQPLSTDEQKILDTALLDADQLLVRSLHDDQRRTRRRIWLSVTLIGGVVMSLLLIAFLAGWLTVTSSGATEAKENSPQVSDEQWQARLLDLEEGGNWFEGAKVGMDLVQISGDRPYDLLKANWPSIATSAKKQILKGFTPGMMGNKQMHSRFFDVMHLGMTDPDKEVREYAAAYIEMQGLPNFKNKDRVYERWWDKNRDLSAEEIVKQSNPSQRGSSAKRQAKPTREQIQQAEKLAAQGWNLWRNQKFVDAAEQFEKAVELDSQAENAWNGLGWARFNSAQHESALAAFDACIKLSPKHPAGLNGLGQLHFHWQEYDEAERYLRKAARYNATASWWGLAKLHLLKGEYPKAKQWAAKIVKQTPNDETAKQILEAAEAGELPDELRIMIEPTGRRRTSNEEKGLKQAEESLNSTK